MTIPSIAVNHGAKGTFAHHNSSKIGNVIINKNKEFFL